MYIRKIIALAALAAAAPAFAQQPAAEGTRLKEVSVSATRTENPADEVPATVSVITSEQMERDMVQDARDLIRYEPNVSVRSDQSRRLGNASFNIRGIEGNRVLMLLDGVRVPDEFSFTASLLNGTSRDVVELETLKRVEILRGSGSPLYGSDAIGGVVSFTTKDPADLLKLTDKPYYIGYKPILSSADRSFTNHLSFAAGRDSAVQGLFWITDRRGHETENKGSVGGYGDARTIANPQTNTAQNMLGKLVLKPAANHTLKFSAEYRAGEADTSVLTGNPSVATDTSLTGQDSAKRLRLGFDHEWRNPWSWVNSLRWNLHRQLSRTYQRSIETRTTPAIRDISFEFHQDTIGGGAQLESRLDYGSHVHRLTYGFDLTQTAYREMRDGSSVNPVTGVVTKTLFPDTFPIRDFPLTETRLFGAFLQDEIALMDARLLLSPGVRADSYMIEPKGDDAFTRGNPTARLQNKSDGAVSPKIGAVWKLDGGWSLYGQLAKGFRAPPALDMFGAFINPGAGSYAIIPNLDLKPERSAGAEGGVRFGGKAADGSLTLFDNRYRDFISSQAALPCPGHPSCVAGFGTTFQSRNLSRVRIYGLEARGEWRFARGWTAIGAFGAANGLDKSTNAPINTIDPAKLATGLRYDAGGWGGQLSGTFVSAVRNGDVNDTSGLGFRSPGYQTFDLTGWYRIDKRMSLNFGLFNLTNEKYWHWSDVRLLSASTSAAAPFLNTGAGFNRADRYTNPGTNLSVSMRVDL